MSGILEKEAIQKATEIVKISLALANWFETQDVDPEVALLVMANTTAACLVHDTKKKKKLDKRYKLYISALVTLLIDKWKNRHD